MKDDTRNQDKIGENEILVVSIGTSFYNSRVRDIKGIEDAIQQANAGWSVRRAFTSLRIVNDVFVREGNEIDHTEQALDRAVANGVKNLIIQPTHLMHGVEYDKLANTVYQYKKRFRNVKIAQPLLGGTDAAVSDADKETVAKALTSKAAQEAGYHTLDAAKMEGAAFVFLGHGSYHTAGACYGQMQFQLKKLGYSNVFIGTVEGKTEETSCGRMLETIVRAGYKKVILRPFMVVAGKHAIDHLAGEKASSWRNLFRSSGNFESVKTQLAGLGSIAAIQKLYVEHTAQAIQMIGINYC